MAYDDGQRVCRLGYWRGMVGGGPLLVRSPGRVTTRNGDSRLSVMSDVMNLMQRKVAGNNIARSASMNA